MRWELRTFVFAPLALAACGGDGGVAAYDVVATVPAGSIGCAPDLFAADGRLFVGADVIFDISDPAAPQQLDSSVPWPGAEVVAVDGDLVYFWEAPTLTLADLSTPTVPTVVKRVELGGLPDEHAVQLLVTDSALVVLRQQVNASDLAIFDLATLPADGVGLVDGWVDLQGLPGYVQGAPVTMAARGDLVVVAGVPSAIAVDVTVPVAPVVTDEVRVEWFAGAYDDPSTWVGFGASGDVLLRGPRTAGHGPFLATVGLSASGAFGEPVFDELDRAGDGGDRSPAIAGDVLMTGAGLYRLDAGQSAFLGTTPELSAGAGPCGLASDGRHFYVTVVDAGLEIVEVP